MLYVQTSNLCLLDPNYIASVWQSYTLHRMLGFKILILSSLVTISIVVTYLTFQPLAPKSLRSFVNKTYNAEFMYCPFPWPL